MEWAHSWREANAEVPLSLEAYRTEVASWENDRIALAFSTGQWFSVEQNKIIPAQSWTGSLMRKADGWHLEADWPQAK